MSAGGRDPSRQAGILPGKKAGAAPAVQERRRLPREPQHLPSTARRNRQGLEALRTAGLQVLNCISICASNQISDFFPSGGPLSPNGDAADHPRHSRGRRANPGGAAQGADVVQGLRVVAALVGEDLHADHHQRLRPVQDRSTRRGMCAPPGPSPRPPGDQIFVGQEVFPGPPEAPRPGGGMSAPAEVTPGAPGG